MRKLFTAVGTYFIESIALNNVPFWSFHSLTICAIQKEGTNLTTNSLKAFFRLPTGVERYDKKEQPSL